LVKSSYGWSPVWVSFKIVQKQHYWAQRHSFLHSVWSNIIIPSQAHQTLSLSLSMYMWGQVHFLLPDDDDDRDK
jgi:hypothetical protein